MSKNEKISAEHPEIDLLDSWISCVEKCNKTTPVYTHQFFSLQPNCDSKIWEQLFDYIKHAHAGAIEALRAPLADTLHPCDYGTEQDPAFGYPHKLNIISLQGFFGEILGGIIAENYVDSGGHSWEVPVYLFKFHVTAFQSLERSKQTGDYTKKVIGRTGDDGLAFVRDKSGKIIAWLAIEAKCTSDHDAGLISANHQKLSDSAVKPIDLIRVIEALGDYDDDLYQTSWLKSLRDLFHDKGNAAKRYNLSLYVYARAPKRQSTWIPIDAPHSEYTGNRELCSAEFCFPDVTSKISMLYGKLSA